MYNEHLSPAAVPIGNIFLDPNNPRFWSEQTRNAADVPDQKVPEETHQLRARNRISEHGIEELKNSILRNGFLPLDRIVVRELAGLGDKYVVIEGNRRLAALLTLRDQISEGTIVEAEISEDYLEKLKNTTDVLEVLVYSGEQTKDIAWMLQGIRHISGIRDWSPAQQGKLVAEQIDNKGLSFTQAGQCFGLSAQAVGRRYRSYKALEQMRRDDDFQSKAENRYYSLFEEAVRQKEVRNWLGWDDEECKFKNKENLKQFYSWICPDEEHELKERRIHDPRHIQHLGRLVAAQQSVLLDRIDKHEIEIEAAYQKLKDVDFRYDWKSAIEKALELLKDIPQSAISENPQSIIDELDSVLQQVEQIKTMAKSIAAPTAEAEL